MHIAWPLMLVMAVAAFMRSRSPEASDLLVIPPIALIALSILSGYLVNPRFRRQIGLMVFHLSLLLLCLLAGIARLTAFEGRVEITEGQMFDPSSVEATKRGWLHPDQLDQVVFDQGPLRFEFSDADWRGETLSTVYTDPKDRRSAQVFGNAEPLVIAGYRFYITPNKGFAAAFTWYGLDDTPQLGSIHFPSYPALEWNQQAEWTSSGGEIISIELPIETLPRRDAAWVLEREQAPGTVTIKYGEATASLAPGDSVSLGDGRLEFSGYRIWTGYRVTYQPLLPWLFALSIVGIAGLAYHYKVRLWGPGTALPTSANKSDGYLSR